MSLPDIPSISDLADNAQSLLQQGLVDATLSTTDVSAADIEVARSNHRVLAFAQAVGVHGAYKYLQNYIAQQAIPTTSTDDNLDLWLAAYDIPRKEATAATGTATASSIAGSTVEGGQEFQSESGLTYITQKSVIATGETVTVSLICTTQGLAGNLSGGVTLTLRDTVEGIDNQFTVDASGIAGGTDTETDAEAQYRLQQRLSNPPRGSSPADYERWALSVPGITRAWGVRNPSGPTTAGVIILADNNPDRLPSEQQKQAVYDYVADPERCPPDEFFPIVPDPVYVDLVLGITPDTPTVRAAVITNLNDLFYREALPGTRMPFSHITEAISSANGEEDHELFSPKLVSGGYIAVTRFQILILRSVTFQAMTNG